MAKQVSRPPNCPRYPRYPQGSGLRFRWNDSVFHESFHLSLRKAPRETKERSRAACRRNGPNEAARRKAETTRAGRAMEATKPRGNPERTQDPEQTRSRIRLFGERPVDVRTGREGRKTGKAVFDIVAAGGNTSRHFCMRGQGHLPPATLPDARYRSDGCPGEVRP